jgi:pyridoxine 5-phosphate synthase
MRRLTLSLDALAALRDAAAATVDVSAAAALAELAGVDALRIGVAEAHAAVGMADAQRARRAARRLELRLAPAQALLKVALEVRPDAVLIAADARARGPCSPLDLRAASGPVATVQRVLAEAGIPIAALLPPEADAVKLAHAAEIRRIDLFTGGIVDLPEPARSEKLERLGDAVRLAAKLRIGVGISGGLDYRSVPEFLAAAPAVESVAVGRAALARSLLVGLDRALRDLRGLIA